MFGYMGKYLVVDLSNGSHQIKELSEDTCYKFIGGAGLGARILYDEMAAGVDVFAPESMVGFVAGALNNTGAMLSARYTVVSKSPVTGGFNDANSGGSFANHLRQSGFDAIFFKGISEKPVYVVVDDGVVSICDATDIWGKCTIDAEGIIKKQLGQTKLGIATIGPAGERKSFMAAVMNDQHRAAGRGGTGAVIGSKNLKALVCKGTAQVELADKDGLKAANKAILNWEKEGPVVPLVNIFKELGTGNGTTDSIISGDAGIKNWLGSGAVDFKSDIADVASAATMDKTRKIKKYACSNCPIGCGAHYNLDDKGYQSERNGRPEYETAGWFSSGMLINSDVPANVCNFLCNEYGFDTISMGGTIAWAMECYSNGVLTSQDLDGIELNWGDGDAVIEICEKICKGESVGLLLQNGSRFAANLLGKGQESLCTANGMEIPMHDPRMSPSLARTYKFDPTPGRHTKGGMSHFYGNEPPEVKYNYENTGEPDAAATVTGEMKNSAGWCEFTGFAINPGGMNATLTATTGQNYDDAEFTASGFRCFTMRQAFNLREGFGRSDCRLDDRLIGIPALEEGPLAGVVVDVDKMGDNFYKAIGYHQNGIPKRETLENLGGLEDVIVDIYGA
ncbi:aldehyde ferredoxin oxidoreductase [Actinomycetota bacterium]|nr:aldehyde ferredoxin oxidoreductase [Actinomycetota bacterium]